LAAAKASSDLRRMSLSVLGFGSVDTAIVTERERVLRHRDEEEKQLRRVSPPAILEAAAISDDKIDCQTPPFPISLCTLLLIQYNTTSKQLSYFPIKKIK
jgi:hypothetical protein